MSSPVVSVPPESPLQHVIERMEHHRIRHVAVTEAETGRLLGLISHRDVLRSQEGSLSGTPGDDQGDMDRWIEARWVMTKEVRTVYPDTSALEAAKTLRSHGYGCVPVIEDGRLVGMLSEADFVDFAIQALSDPGI